MNRTVAALLLLGSVACLARADDKPASKKPATPTYQIPYRLTDTKHVLVRAKLNGKGPFNFILDTGAPAVFIPNKVAKEIGLKTDAKGWGEFSTFQIEGGLTVEKARGRVEDLFQLEGMNGMGLAGVELHGVIGYNILAKYRITYDFTQEKLAFTPLNYSPPDPKGIGGGGQGGLEMMGTMMKVLAGLMGSKPNFDVESTGMLGVEFAPTEKDAEGVVVKSVLGKSPADQAGLKPGDIIKEIRGSTIEDLADLNRALEKKPAGTKLTITVLRDKKEKELTLTLGKGI